MVVVARRLIGRFIDLSACLLVGLVIVGGALPATAQEQGDGRVSVGSKKFTESVILGEMARILMQDGKAGVTVTHSRQLGGTRILWEALAGGDLHVYPEYTGTIDQEIFAGRALSDREALRRAAAERGVGMTRPLGFDNTYALGMRRERARQLGIETISDLREHPQLTLGFSNEFMDREDGWPGLRRHYELPQTNIRGMDHDLAYRGLEAGSVDVVDLYSTDPEIQYYDLKVLRDDASFFPGYQAVFLYRQRLAERHPQAVRALERLEGRISAQQMSALNKRVKIDGASEARVAADFLADTLGVTTTIEEEGFWSRFLRRSWEHLFMVLVSMAAAIAVGVPLGIWAGRRTRAEQFILGFVGILQTMPALAMLVFMIPPFGIGTRPAIAALFLYSLLPIVRNTHAGLLDVPNETLESARALGLPAGVILRKVELPLAMRSILAGIKTSVVINVGVATLGALIGAGGYGQPILTGIRLDDMSLILEGAVPAAGLALGMQGLFELVERWAVPPALRLEDTAG